MSIRNLLTQSALVESVATSQTGTGGFTKVYSTRIASMKCLLHAKTLRETDDTGKLTVNNTWRLYAEATTINLVIEESDRITISGTQYEVKGIYNACAKDKLLHIELVEFNL